MNKASKVALCLLISAMLVFFAGCKLNESANSGDSTGNPAVDGSTVLAKVGDREVLLQDFNSYYNAYVSMYTMYGYDVESDEAMKKEIQASVMDSLIQKQVILYQAEQQGFTDLTEEQQAELDNEIEDTLLDMDNYFRSQAETEAETDPTIDVEERIKELVKEEADYYYPDLHLTADEYRDMIADGVRESYYTNLLQQSVFAEVSVSEDEISDWYDDTLAASKEEYAEDPTYYKEDQENFELYGGDPVPYAPEGYSRIMHILIAPEEEMSEEYSTKTEKLEELVNEYGKLGIAAANGENNAARMSEIVNEYNALKAEIDQMEVDYYADAKAEAEAAYARLESGEEFALVMKETTQDADFTNYDVLREKGKLIYDGDAEWSDLIHEQFAALAPGQYSAVFQDEDGFHIIYYVGDEPSGEIALSELHEDISAMLLYEKQNSEWNACVEEWSKDKSVTIESAALKDNGISYTA